MLFRLKHKENELIYPLILLSTINRFTKAFDLQGLLREVFIWHDFGKYNEN